MPSLVAWGVVGTVLIVVGFVMYCRWMSGTDLNLTYLGVSLTLIVAGIYAPLVSTFRKEVSTLRQMYK